MIDLIKSVGDEQLSKLKPPTGLGQIACFAALIPPLLGAGCSHLPTQEDHSAQGIPWAARGFEWEDKHPDVKVTMPIPVEKTIR